MAVFDLSGVVGNTRVLTCSRLWVRFPGEVFFCHYFVAIDRFFVNYYFFYQS